VQIPWVIPKASGEGVETPNFPCVVSPLGCFGSSVDEQQRLAMVDNTDDDGAGAVAAADE